MYISRKINPTHRVVLILRQTTVHGVYDPSECIKLPVLPPVPSRKKLRFSFIVEAPDMSDIEYIYS